MDEKRKMQRILNQSLSGLKENPFLSQRVIAQAKGEKPVKKRISFSVIIIVAILLIGTMTALAAGVEDINAMLYKIWPEGARALMPVNLSSEDQGIRLEIISAVNKDAQLLVTYSLQDLEGDRLSQISHPFLSLKYKDIYFSSASEGPALEYDESHHRVTCSQYEKCDDDVLAMLGDGEITAKLRAIWPLKCTTVDLSPYLTFSGEAVCSDSIPEDAVYYSSSGESLRIPDSFRILETGSLQDIPLFESVGLSGIGIIDGSLHIRIHYTDRQTIQSGSFEYSPYNTWISVSHRQNDVLYENISRLQWGDDSPLVPEWEEFIISVEPELLKDSDVSLEIQKHLPLILGNWEVKIPLRIIQYNH